MSEGQRLERLRVVEAQDAVGVIARDDRVGHRPGHEGHPDALQCQ